MSFRARLSLFFATIVIVPMIAVALVLFSLTEDSETGKADARIANGLRSASALYGDERARAQGELRRVARDPELRRALAAGDGSAVSARMSRLARGRVESVALYDRGGRATVGAGSRYGVAEAAATARDERGRALGTIALSVTDARAFARRTTRITGLETRLFRDRTALASTIGGDRGANASSGDVKLQGRDYRGRFQEVRTGPTPPVMLGVFEDASGISDAVADSRWLIGLVLLGFLLLSLVSSVLVVRALQGQVGELLGAARRLARGDFRSPVPTHGSDEFAELGSEFNEMSRQLELHIAEVERQRRDFEQAMRRVGEAFAAGLDRHGLADIAIQTAVAACCADAGRALPVDPRKMMEVCVGDCDERRMPALEAAERGAFTVGADIGRELIAALELSEAELPDPSGPSRAEVDGVYALAVPLRARVDARSDVHFVGAMSIAREESDFSQAEADLFAYLAGQAAVSIENAALHETVQLQAVTDGLTGLRNVRHFHETLDGEIERSRRFGTDVGLVMLDLDDFKPINDTYGHQQGDLVLIEVARVLRELSRDIDEPARYGGEELAVVLPQTDLSGAELAAERMRAAIEELEVKRIEAGPPLKVTASFGVASLPATAPEKETLIAVADAALYRAKRGGKNRVVRAEPAAAPR